ncbi:hypothetical protein N7492_008548 [Penicillium capsulatum]|uniref:Small ribosomal subunit protein mS38 n=1 Tax=Penicillium capsulatum TaxID=69766 RepID=A0A9W9HTA8_9EURO|nr:hypothetical protein N7492_008548 [Penicillium capsulatum]KAJ6105953.1 hypothetical protein N7512_009470 [Penicillium capsulatum]
MLSTSLRRAAWAPLPGIPRTAPSAPASGFVGATRPLHQRRYSSSSSKPPVPPSDGPRRMDTSTPAKVNSSGEKGKSVRRRGKDNSARNGSSKMSQQDAAFSKLPSVPSTQHRQPHGKYLSFAFILSRLVDLDTNTSLFQDVHVASFFSIHRPISVTTTVPPISSSEAFDAIFSKRLLKNEPEDVIFTLSSTVQSMENSAQGMSESDDQFNQLHQSFTSDANGELQMVDGSEAKLSVEELTRRLRPFHPPPPPVPMDMNSSTSETMESAEAENQETTYSTVLTIRESRHADGRKTYEAHTGPFVRDEMEEPASVQDGSVIDAPTGSTSGMTYVERQRHNRTMHAISTKRRRKVKMKKHKFKKLMRRTRTLRRKLDKA